jgi:hypothetical protein
MLAERRWHRTLPVSDLEEARQFCEVRLGFSPVEVNELGLVELIGE